MAEESHRNIDPVVSYAFIVQIEGIAVARFNGVDGLSYEVEMIEYRDSESPNLPQFRQGRRKPGRVTLKRGILVGGNTDLLTWIRQVEKGSIQPRNIAISIGNYGGPGAGGPGIHEAKGPSTWLLYDCKPTKWSMGNLDGNSNSPLIESLELVVSSVSVQG
ncbi:MAG: phage tail protein [Proteobacteria bacterium]|nr:phage tail protein [Pseudomonadota bacterium]MBQ4358825.1 phage tail protein [Pseudomonadota bacterium]